MGEHDPFYRRSLRAVAAVIGVAAVALGCLPSDTDVTRPQIHVAEGSPDYDGDELVVMTANLYGGRALPMTSSNEEFIHRDSIKTPPTNTRRYLEVIDERQPDILLAEEVPSDPQLFDGLRERGYNYIFVPSRNLPQRGIDGNYIMVKQANIEFVADVTLPTNNFDRLFLQEVRKLVHARIANTDGTHTSVLVTHMANTDSDWPGQARAIRDYILSQDLPESETIILGGDMNATIEQVRTSALQDIFHVPDEVQPFYTYPTNKITLRGGQPDQDPDHILIWTPDMACTVLNLNPHPTLDNIASDHGALTVTIQNKNCESLRSRLDTMGTMIGR